MADGRRPVNIYNAVPRGKMLADTLFASQKIKQASPERNYGLGIARVVEVDYEEFLVSLQVVMGASGDSVRVPVPLTFPGAGNRHFFGSMPQQGDYCVVGWMPQESSNPTNKTPVILAWVVPGTWPGREWVTTSNFTHEEADLSSPKDRDVVRGFLDRVRHKLRHAQPGNIVASSAQGADLVLDEGVTLANRRGNEIRLRDQDQAFIVRALQEFHALGGARIYTGMVQRDAQFLATSMVSDGKVWDGNVQTLLGRPLTEAQLPPDVANPKGKLTPAKVLGKGLTEGGLTRALLPVDERLDPFSFLQKGGFIDANGFAVDDRHVADAIYGGKPIYRVAAGSRKNAVLDPKAPTLTEYRVEVAHTSDGRLPVTEQTDMFDAERLPGSDPKTPGKSPNAPFIQWVMGSVIGNDPFSEKGREAYGLPLVAKVFDGTVPNPRLEAAVIPAVQGQGQATPMEEHAATLFHLTPISGEGAATFWSVNKKGQVRMAVGGPAKEMSVEAHLQGGMRLGMNGGLHLQVQGGIHFGTRSRSSLSLYSDQGPVVIYGGGTVGGAEALGERIAGTGKREGDLPSVDIQAEHGVRIKATKKVMVKGGVVEVNATSTRLAGHQDVQITSGGRVGVSAEVLSTLVSGKMTQDFSGPKGFLPTSGPLHERTYTPVSPGLVAEKVTYSWGDREEEFKFGNHTTTIQVGKALYDVKLGTFTARALASEVVLGAEGVKATAGTGNVVLTAVAGTASLIGLSGVLVSAPAGVATVRGSLGVYLGGPLYGPDMGPILCAGSLEPFTGLPFGTWGLGAKGHVIGV